MSIKSVIKQNKCLIDGCALSAKNRGDETIGKPNTSLAVRDILRCELDDFVAAPCGDRDFLGSARDLDTFDYKRRAVDHAELIDTAKCDQSVSCCYGECVRIPGGIDGRKQNLAGSDHALVLEPVAQHCGNRSSFGIGFGENGDLFVGAAPTSLQPGLRQRLYRWLEPIVKLDEAALIERF